MSSISPSVLLEKLCFHQCPTILFDFYEIKKGIIDDKELLEDIILVATNDVLDQILKMKNNKLGKYTNGLGGLF